MKKLFSLLWFVFSIVPAQADDLDVGSSGTFTVVQRQHQLASLSYQVTRNSDSVKRISASAIVSGGNNPFKISSTTDVGNNNELLAYRASSQTGRRNLVVRVSVGESEWTTSFAGFEGKETFKVSRSDQLFLFDNNNIAHFVLFAAKLNSSTRNLSGDLLIPFAGMSTNFTLTNEGDAVFTYEGNTYSCEMYKMLLGGLIELDFYKNQGRLLAIVQPGEEIQIVRTD